MASIKQRPDGVWRARYRDAAGKEHSRHFKRKVDGQRWLDEVTASVITGRYVDPKAGKIAFSVWYEHWMTRQVWAAGTHESASMILRSIPFAEKHLNQIMFSDVQLWIKEMSSGAKPLSPKTVRNRYNFARMAFQAAIKDKRIAEDPTDDVKLPRVRRVEASMAIPTPEQVGEFLGEAPLFFRAYVAVCAFAGLRLGEASGLQLSDIDFLRKTITVSRQVQGQTKAKTEVVSPKNGSERVVYVAEPLINILAYHVKEVGVWGDEQWLFGTGGHLWHRMMAGYHWRTLREKVGADEFTLHDLRHFYASGLIATGCDVVTVQRALGHALPSITLNTYSHLWPTAEDKTRAAANEMMTAALESSADSLRTIALG
ncbi:tyrosine-type recombinase/integrase [Corynebacterium casei]|uniref:tyrosine-type recombinase/integrase n=1 Tax=Actinomycetes TaxID=1760 RepID=UPI003F96B79C